jgi:hypothetical protein
VPNNGTKAFLENLLSQLVGDVEAAGGLAKWGYTGARGGCNPHRE